jgi:excisionase family DNA binding protein
MHEKTIDENERDVVGVREIASYLGLDARTIYGALARGEIPHLRIGGSVLVSRSVVDAKLGKGKRVGR